MLSLQTKLIGVVLAALLLFGLYSYIGYSAVEEYKAEQKVLQDKADAKQREKYENLEAELIVAKAARKIEYKTLVKTVERVVKAPVYAQPCIDAEGLEVANKALGGGVKNELY